MILFGIRTSVICHSPDCWSTPSCFWPFLSSMSHTIYHPYVSTCYFIKTYFTPLCMQKYLPAKCVWRMLAKMVIPSAGKFCRKYTWREVIMKWRHTYTINETTSSNCYCISTRTVILHLTTARAIPIWSSLLKALGTCLSSPTYKYVRPAFTTTKHHSSGQASLPLHWS